ncbi:MAG: T9SS type A sorting domain-containing protein [Bacteroidales bacterium]|nr:T9SS type A sorting domain-containing protein [Bacteroidales bacterium]
MKIITILILSVLFFLSGLTIAQNNLATGATPAASASSNGNYGPSNWNDGLIGPNYYFGWVGTDNSYPQPAWIQYEWNNSQTLNRLVFYPPTWNTGGGVPFNGNADLQYWDGSAWQTHISYFTTNTTTPDTLFFQQITTTKIRLTDFTCYGGENPGWDEIEAYYVPPVNVDVGVSSLENQFNSSPPQTKIKIWVRNYSDSLDAYDIPVYCKPGMSGVMNGFVTDTINPGDSVLYTFNDWFVIPIGTFQIITWAEAYGDLDHSNDTSTFVITPYSGIPDQNQTESTELITLIPNPASNKLNMKFNQSGEKQVTCYTLNGQKVLCRYTSKRTLKLDVSEWLPGVYFVDVKTTDGSYTITKLLIH